jgi:uncharacterized protein (TIRG00374 family)
MPHILVRRLVAACVLGVLVFIGFSLYADLSKLEKELSTFAWWLLVPTLVLSLGNYLLRFAKWHYYLRHLGIEVPRRLSFSIFLSGLVMSVTPGKLGEVLKSYLLREAAGVPMARTTPVVIAERLTDLIALVVLAIAFVASFRLGAVALLASVLLLVGCVALIAYRPAAVLLLHAVGRLPRLAGLSHKLEEFYVAMAALVRPLPLGVASALSIVAWGCECIGLYLVVVGLAGPPCGLDLVTFIYASTTLLGALSFLPGGLGVTEGSMAALLVQLGGQSGSQAVAATLLVRICTLWFAVAVGLVALLRFCRRLGLSIELPQAPPPERGVSGSGKDRRRRS